MCSRRRLSRGVSLDQSHRSRMALLALKGSVCIGPGPFAAAGGAPSATRNGGARRRPHLRPCLGELGQFVETWAAELASLEADGTCRRPQTWTRLAVNVAVVGSNPGALKNPLAEKTTPTPSPTFRSEKPSRKRRWPPR